MLRSDSGLHSQGYIDYMVATVSRGTFEEGMVLLWAMEKVSLSVDHRDIDRPGLIRHFLVQLYLDAWTFASTHLPSDAKSPSSSYRQSAGSQRALLELIPNWSSAEFGQFVFAIGELVDDFDVQLDSDLGRRVQEVWTTTLWFEERFWEAGES